MGTNLTQHDNRTEPNKFEFVPRTGGKYVEEQAWTTAIWTRNDKQSKFEATRRALISMICVWMDGGRMGEFGKRAARGWYYGRFFGGTGSVVNQSAGNKNVSSKGKRGPGPKGTIFMRRVGGARRWGWMMMMISGERRNVCGWETQTDTAERRACMYEERLPKVHGALLKRHAIFG